MDAARTRAPARRTSRSSSTGATATHMPAHDFEADEALEEGVKIHWLRSDRGASTAARSPSRSWSSMPTGRPRGTGRVRDARGRRPDPGRSARTPTPRFLRGVPGVAVQRRRHRGRWTRRMMTGRPGPLRRRRHGARGAHASPCAVGPRQEGGAPHRRVAARRDLRQARRPAAMATFDKLHLWFYTDVAQRPQARAPLASAGARLRRGRRRA